MQDHPDKEALRGRFKVKRRYNSAMYRQIAEAITIRQTENNNKKILAKVLNNKLE